MPPSLFSGNTPKQPVRLRLTVGLILLLAAGPVLLTGAPDYLRSSLQYSTETSQPKFAGVPQLTTPPAGELPKYYRQLQFSGGSDHARGPLHSAGAGGISRQARTALSGSIDYAYDVGTDQVTWTNRTLSQAGEVLDVPPWDPATTDWPQPPVLTVEVPVGGGGPVNYGQWYISANNPLGLTVRSATRAAADNVFHGGIFGGNTLDPVEWQDYGVMELTDEDTQAMAESRAKVTKIANATDANTVYSIRGTPSNGIPWTIRKVHVTSRFEAGNICSGGLYEQRRVFQRRAVGAGGWQDYKVTTKTIKIKEANQLIEENFDLPLEEGYEIRLADLTYEATGSDCASCGADGGLAGGTRGATAGSIRWDMPLGLTPTGDSAGFLTLYSDHITPALYTPAALNASVAGDAATVLRDAQDAVRQILAPQALVDVVTTGTESYEIRLYNRTDVSGPGPDGLYVPVGAAYQVWRIDRPGPGVWRQTRIINGQQLVTLVDESVSGRRIFSEAGGLRITETTESTDNGDRVESVIVKNAAGVVASKTKIWYHPFAWGEERVKEVRDPDGAALTTEWTYVTDPNSGAYRKVVSTKRPDGYVESTAYHGDASGRVANVSEPFWRNNTKGTSYVSSVADLNGDGAPDYLSTATEGVFLSLLGVTHTIAWGGDFTFGGTNYKRRESRRAPTGGAWDHAANIITRYRFYAEGAHEGELAYRLDPDGTLFLRRFVANPDGGTAIVEEQGAADAAGETVGDGTRSSRTVSASGWLVASSVVDIATGRLLESQTVGQADGFGRPLRIQHTDGAAEVRSYCSSCGSLVQVTLRGQTVAYEYDDLGRRTLETRLAGATVQSKTRFEYDAEGRLIQTFRVNPTDATETLLASATYDLAGRAVQEFSLATGTTNQAHAFGANNSTITTTTYADGGTRIETRAPNGQVYKLAGTTVAPVEYEWGHHEWWGGGVGYLAFTRRFYDATNYVTETSGINLLGEVADTSYPDGAVARRFFDAIGRLAREVDLDGVTTLYGYDARGRLAGTAVDLNGNSAIDYGGPDRPTRTLSAVGEREGHTVQRTTTQVWETDGQDAPTSVSVSEQSADGLHSWQTVRGLTTATVVAFDGSGGRTVTSTAPDGTVTVQTYLGDRLLSALTSHPSLGTLGSTTYAYDDLGRLVSTTNLRNGTTAYAYDASDRLHTVTQPDPDPARSGPGYDPQITIYAYDVMGRPTTVTQPDNTVVSTTYFEHGQVRRTWGSRSYPVEYTYDLNLRVKTLATWQDFAGDAGKAVTTWNYDNARGWLNNKRYADNTGPTYLYKSSGRLFRRTWARGSSTDYAYNAAGDLAGVDYSDSTPDVTITYDRAGRPQTLTDGAGTRTLAYDPASGQLKDEDYTAGLLAGLGVHRTFDPLQRLDSLSALSVSSVLNQAGYSYDPASRLNVVTSGTNTATYGYVANASLVGSVTFKQSGDTRLATTKTYDNLNRLVSISSAPSASSVLNHSYTYNAANQRTRVTREDSAHWDYGYDALGQVTSGRKLTAGGATVPGHDFAWTYDDIGNRKAATFNAQVSDYVANLLNQYASRTVPSVVDVLGAARADATVTITTDGGQPQPVTRQGELFYRQLTTDNSTTAAFQAITITGVKNSAGPAGEDAVTEFTRDVYVPVSPEAFTHDADGNLTADAHWTYAWDAENRLVRMETKPYDPATRAPGGLLGKYYNYTSGTVWSGVPALERVESVDFDWGEGSPGPGVGADKFNVLWTGEVKAPVTGDYIFETQSDDGAEFWINGIQVIANWAVQNGASTVASAPVHLDAGQRYPVEVYFFNASGPATMRLRWRQPGDAVTQSIPAGSLYHRPPARVARRLEFGYDHQGRRVARKVLGKNDTAWTVASEIRYLYDDWNLLAELNALSANAVVRTYAWGLDLSGSLQGAGGVGGLLFATQTLDPSSQVPTLGAHAPAFDGNGNVIGLVDMGSGVKSAEYEYDAFGNVIIADGAAANACPFGFSTHYLDQETGLSYAKNRFIKDGRFLNRDPLEEDGGANLYGFVGNDPINRIDPYGLATIVAGSNQQIIDTIADFFNGGPSNTWIFNYPHSVAKRFQQHKAIAWVWQLYDHDIQSYCEFEPGGKKTQQIDFQFTASFNDFKADVVSVLGFWREGASSGDFGTNSFGSFHVSGEISIDCCKKEKSIKLDLFNRWSTPSLTRNPITRKPLINGDVWNPVDLHVKYDLHDHF